MERSRKRVYLSTLSEKQLRQRAIEQVAKAKESREKRKVQKKSELATKLEISPEIAMYVTESKDGKYNFARKGLTLEELKDISANFALATSKELAEGMNGAKRV